MSEPGFEVPKVERPPSWGTNWRSFDVPRIWDMVRLEGTWAAWEQIGGFVALSDLLDQQHKLWRVKRDRIAAAWQSSVAEQFLVRLDVYGADMSRDAAYARQTASALNQTVTTLATAREQVRPLAEQWEQICVRERPRFWGYTADRLNREARTIMAETDKVVASARPYIAVPDYISPTKDTGDFTIISGGSGDTDNGAFLSSHGIASGQRIRIPPIPGYEPVVGARATPDLAEITGAPQFVRALPGQPVSMLPVPPGNPYAPFGGAYLLPGPGVGGRGYIVPMQHNPGAGGGRQLGGSRPLVPPMSAGAGPAGGVAGMMPMPMAGGPGGGAAGHGPLYRRPTVKWQNDSGVTPVIRIEEDEFVLNQPSPKQEEEFRDWFSDLAYPWRTEFKTDDGANVTIRTVQR